MIWVRLVPVVKIHVGGPDTASASHTTLALGPTVAGTGAVAPTPPPACQDRGVFVSRGLPTIHLTLHPSFTRPLIAQVPLPASAPVFQLVIRPG